MSMGKILVADDDRNIAELLRLYLERGVHRVGGRDGKRPLPASLLTSPDMVLLDIMMQSWTAGRSAGRSGKSNCPIIMITAKGETFDKVPRPGAGGG